MRCYRGYDLPHLLPLLKVILWTGVADHPSPDAQRDLVAYHAHGLVAMKAQERGSSEMGQTKKPGYKISRFPASSKRIYTCGMEL